MEMLIYDQEGSLLQDPDLTLGHLVNGSHPVYHEAIAGVDEQGHYETVREYPNGGKDVQWVVDVPGVEACDAWVEEQPCRIYIPYTQEELDAMEEEKSKPTMEQRLEDALREAEEAKNSLESMRYELQAALAALMDGMAGAR